MRYPEPDEFLRRLRALYCRHHPNVTYEQYDAHPPTLQELIELVEVLSCEVNSVFGIRDFLFHEDFQFRKQARERMAAIEVEIQRIQKVACGRKEILERYKGQLDRLRLESKALAAVTGVDTG
jgi:hypothetical protein